MKSGKYFIITEIELLKERNKLKKLTPTSTIRDVKSWVELLSGIPAQIQRMKYLDECDLRDDAPLREYAVVCGGTITVDIWTEYKDLVNAAMIGKLNEVMKYGVVGSTEFDCPSAAYLTGEARENALRDRSAIVLFIAAQRGQKYLCQDLLKIDRSLVEIVTSTGRTVLHAAACKERMEIVQMFLEAGVDLLREDEMGLTAAAVAHMLGQKAAERILLLQEWNQRAETSLRSKQKAKLPVGRFQHQAFDSSYPIWTRGPYSQMYCAKLDDPGSKKGDGHSSRDADTISREQQARKAESDEAFVQWIEMKKEEEEERKIAEENQKRKDKEKKRRQELARLKKLGLPEPKSKDDFGGEDDRAPASYEQKSTRKDTKDYKFYKGMSYEEWVKVKKDFLSDHAHYLE